MADKLNPIGGWRIEHLQQFYTCHVTEVDFNGQDPGLTTWHTEMSFEFTEKDLNPIPVKGVIRWRMVGHSEPSPEFTQMIDERWESEEIFTGHFDVRRGLVSVVTNEVRRVTGGNLIAACAYTFSLMENGRTMIGHCFPIAAGFPPVIDRSDFLRRWERRRLLLLAVEASQILSFSVAEFQERHQRRATDRLLDTNRRHELRLFLIGCFSFAEREEVVGIPISILLNPDLVRIIAAFL